MFPDLEKADRDLDGILMYVVGILKCEVGAWYVSLVPVRDIAFFWGDSEVLLDVYLLTVLVL